MTGIKEKIENNIVVWMLGTLLTGFMAGIGTYEGALKIMDLETINKDRLKALEALTIRSSVKNTEIYSVKLPAYLNTSEIELLFTKLKSSYNQNNATSLYNMLGPIRRSQLTEKVAELQMEPVFQSLGKIKSGFFVNYRFSGQQGMYKVFILNYSVIYEKAEKGIAVVTVIDDGSSYQIDGVIFNRL